MQELTVDSLRLATKLVRITADLKRRYDEENAGGAKGPRVRDYRAEERIAELQQEVETLRCLTCHSPTLHFVAEPRARSQVRAAAKEE